MERFFKKPTVEQTVDYIHTQIIQTHETGGKTYSYDTTGLSLSFINDVIDRLSEKLLDVDVIEVYNNSILIDWS